MLSVAPFPIRWLQHANPKIRLLLHSISQSWETHVIRMIAQPRLFMPSSNLVQEAIPEHWAITLLMPERGSGRGGALIAFLADIKLAPSMIECGDGRDAPANRATPCVFSEAPRYDQNTTI
jgi:hypothetical protein